jgi:mono/diheme cytochrome c family protein
MKSTISQVTFILFCSSLFLQCGGPGVHSSNAVGAKDSVSTTDSASLQSNQEQIVALTYEQRQGGVLYTEYCAICHGATGKGDGFNAYNLDPKPRDFTDSRAMSGINDATMRTTISEGGKGVNKSPLMPAWGGRMNKLEMEYLVEYVKFLEQQH